MEPVTVVLGGVTVAVISGVVGKSFGSRNNVKEGSCGERRAACSTLIIEKIDNLTKIVGDLKDAVNGKTV